MVQQATRGRKQPTNGRKVARKTQLPTDFNPDELAGHASSGMENVRSEDLLIPRITILQALSPQLKKSRPEYIERAREGMICATGTGEVWEDGIFFLPVHFRKSYIEWAPRESNQGLVNIHESADILRECTYDDKGRAFLPNGNSVQETAQFFGLNASDGFNRSFIGMAATQLKHSRRWLAMATNEKLQRSDGSRFTAPLWYRTYHLTTAEEGNSQGDWQVWKIARGVSLPEIGGITPDFPWQAVKDEAISFQEMLRKGEARADLKPEATEEEVPF